MILSIVVRVRASNINFSNFLIKLLFFSFKNTHFHYKFIKILPFFLIKTRFFGQKKIYFLLQNSCVSKRKHWIFVSIHRLLTKNSEKLFNFCRTTMTSYQLHLEFYLKTWKKLRQLLPY